MATIDVPGDRVQFADLCGGRAGKSRIGRLYHAVTPALVTLCGRRVGVYHPSVRGAFLLDQIECAPCRAAALRLS